MKDMNPKDNRASGCEPALCERLKFSYRSLIHLLIIAAVGFLAYSNTFQAPFQWDEQTFIKGNPAVKDLNYFLEPSRAKGLELYGALKNRYIGYLTFALNYKLHGLDVMGYHIFNFTVHILNAMLVYLLVVLTFRTPFLSDSSMREHSRYIAFFTSLLFISHPVQTEAVTYIFQRLASLMTFFYLLSLAAYACSRLSTKNTARYALYALSLISAVLAMKTKENAFTLPVVITLYEFLFFTGSRKIRILRLMPLLLTLFIIPLTLTAGTDGSAEEILSGIIPAKDYLDVSRKDYFLTELRVIVTYVRLLLFPANQNIDYEYPVFHSFLNPEVFLSFLFFLSVLGFAVYLFYRSRFKGPASRVIAFGIFWFFITLSIESSLIPIPMLIDEYRLYLPSVGVFLSSITGAFVFLGKIKSKKVQRVTISAIILVPLVFSYAAHARNNVWKSEVSLWKDVVSKSPLKARPHNNLGLAYRAKGLTGKAIEQFQTALRMSPGYVEAHNNLGFVYWSEGLFDKAIRHYLIAIKLKPDFAEAHNNLGLAYEARGLTEAAVREFQTAIRLNPDFSEAHNNLGLVFSSRGLTDKAITHYLTALRLKPENVEARYNIGLIYLENGSIEEARKQFEMVLSITPEHCKAREFLEYISKSQ